VTEPGSPTPDSERARLARDPTVITEAAIARAKDDLRREAAALKELADAKLHAFEVRMTSTWELHKSDIQQAVAEIRALKAHVDEKFSERDVRFADRDRADAEALSAALSAAKELSISQRLADREAADKFQQAVLRQIEDQNRQMAPLQAFVTGAQSVDTVKRLDVAQITQFLVLLVVAAGTIFAIIHG
jgi:hypothetical protein